MEYIKVIASPIGNLKITIDEFSLLAIDFVEKEATNYISKNNLLEEVENQLNEYFDGKRTSFTIPTAPKGTDFQKRVWSDLETIPFGETRSYKEMAIQLGNIKQIRAAASANGRNPIPIIIPCHRVIGSNGSLTGYSGGLDKKEWLLKFESFQEL